MTSKHFSIVAPFVWKARGCLLGRLFTILSVLRIAAPSIAQPTSPLLNIFAANGNVTVSWPASAYYFVLEGTTNLSSSVPWPGVATASRLVSDLSNIDPSGYAPVTTNIIGDKIMVALPATNDLQFFRIKETSLIPVFQFAIFYNGLLEFSTANALVISGPVHANGPIYTGSASPLTFNDTVTTATIISSPANNGQGPAWTYRGTYSGNPPLVTNVSTLLLPAIGTNNPHAIIDMPPNGEDPNSALGQMRLFNQAHIVLLVSNAYTTARIQASPGMGQLPGADPFPILLNSTNDRYSLSANFPFLTLTNTFVDQRENSKSNITTQIDLGKYARWISTNPAVLAKYPAGYGIGPLILYVADNRTCTPLQLTVVRITNGIAPPSDGGFGFTLATPNPLYIWGNYNCTNSTHLATTNTIANAPCALISDALTILSANWQDSQSASAYTSRTPATTTFNAAIITGTVSSTGTNAFQFSGGVQNLPRLLENWSGVNLWLNTSLVNLFTSQRATNKFINPGGYYGPPTRHFNFDSSFRNPAKLPPGTPLVGGSVPAN